MLVAFEDINEEKPIHILHIEDNIGDARILQETLRETINLKYSITHASCLEDGISMLHKDSYDVIFLDLCLPEGNDEILVDRIKNYAFKTPIIVLSGTHNEKVALNALKKGAQDFLQKDQINANMIVRAIRYAIFRKHSELKLTYLAKYDTLTGLANRDLFYDRLQQAILRSCRSREMVALLFIDLDRFKQVNDQYGHHTGDELLKAFALRVKKYIRAQDTFARLSGDEFTIILEKIHNKDNVTNIAEELTKAISEPFLIQNKKINISCSIGITLNGNDNISSKALIKQSDIAMYRAKNNGRNNFKFYTPDMEQYITSKTNFKKELENAIKNDELHLDYQPQYDSNLERIVGAEALIRWHHPNKGTIQPIDFIPILEETGLIIEAGEWVLNTACKQWHTWQMQGKIAYESIISVNVSAKQFCNNEFIKQVANALEISGLAPGCLDLEITENILLENSERNIETLQKFKRIGVKLSIDDFGTGFSSLNYLKYFPVDRLKIDKSFVENIINNEKDSAISATIINLAKNLNLEVVAEGVDNVDKADLLNEIGCHIFQGYYFGTPQDSNTFIHTINLRDSLKYLH